MKKILFVLIVCMMLTFGACRPAEEAPSGSSTAGEGGQTEQAEQPVTPTPDENKTPDTETPIADETEEPVTDESGTPVEDETGTPTDTPERTYGIIAPEDYVYVDDPVLRAEADRIRKEKGEESYKDFCFDNDLKAYRNIPIEDDFRTEWIFISLMKAVSDPEMEIPKLEGIEYEAWKDFTYYPQDGDYSNFHKGFMLTVNCKSKEEILDLIKELEKFDFVLAVEVEGIYVFD